MPYVSVHETPEGRRGTTQHDNEEKKRMSGKIKQVARSKRSHRDDKNFRQFAWNAHRTAEEKAKIKFGHMLAEEMKKNREEKAEQEKSD